MAHLKYPVQTRVSIFEGVSHPTTGWRRISPDTPYKKYGIVYPTNEGALGRVFFWRQGTIVFFGARTRGGKEKNGMGHAQDPNYRAQK